MNELPKAIPDVEVLLALEAEELGAKLLFLLKQRPKQNGSESFHVGNIEQEHWYNANTGQPCYPRDKEDRVNQAVAEAWAWLKVQCLIVPTGGTNSNGHYRLSRRAEKYENEAQFASYAVSRMLPNEALHPKIAKTVWMAYMRGEFDVAVFQAMKAVEVAVREKSGIPKLLGRDLMRKAFHPQTGPLSDYNTESGEREARSALFDGAIGSYKNPNSHRDVNLSDPREAVEIILLANHLLRIVDACSFTAPKH